MQFRKLHNKRRLACFQEIHTKFGNGLRAPEVVGAPRGLLQRPRHRLSKREKVEGPLDLLLLAFGQRIQLRNSAGKDKAVNGSLGQRSRAPLCLCTFVPFQKCLGVALLSIDLASSASLDFSLDRRHGPSHHYIKRTTTKERLSFAMSSMGLLPSRSHDSH